MFKKIKIENFRGITNLELNDFGQINLFVGKNNCGKTTILESLFFLIGPTNPALPLNVNVFRGLKEVDENFWLLFLNKLDLKNNISISGEMDDLDEKRELKIIPNTEFISTKPAIDKESFDIKSVSYSGFNPVISGLILHYTSTKKKDKKNRQYSYSKDKKNKQYTYSFEAKIITTEEGIKIIPPKNYKELQKGVIIPPDYKFRDIALRFNKLQIEKRVNRIVNILQEIEPSLINLSLGAKGIIYCDIGLDKLIPINVMGDGIVKLFFIISAIADMANGGIVLVDEIENGLHHLSQSVLWKAIFKVAKDFNVQIFATTHSIECVQAFSNSYYDSDLEKDSIRLYRIERENNNFSAVTYDSKSLLSSLEGTGR